MVVTERVDSNLADALESLRNGGFVLLHDATSRENEIDMVVAAEFASPERVRMMRTEAGGLLCVALSNEIGKKLGLVMMHDIFLSAARQYPILRSLNEDETPYGGKAAFSITVNHRRTFTGVTDLDRSLTICELAHLAKKTIDNGRDSTREFAKAFKAPGHVYLLLESEGSLEKRRGHTELSVHLCELAGLTPVAALCEMLDGNTHKALSIHSARIFARENTIPIIEADQVMSNFFKGNDKFFAPQSVNPWSPGSS
ncbi:MAG TPA: 3,4-dihydroxy-2-butanone-4-phosphate synthase [Candidatus Acidoferrum sp.]|nr:3,4-dihydroxy-2-butanone-4-phosphate synthase [Candidatus Acidoferrum sp.]